ncbi:hypothetical protein [Neomesorhizobium albiziae]|uniref:hypothetical protein n=1 Tax=Neomesorhizobium albiziae TaxID=335020 RepID=UPI00165EC40E|nr:hypothetical protein [Mesorhizobium albiziae]GLS30816.1 hypothetical protein GCM10007937_25240 [Mesorhizobium albiziae]
MQVATIPKFFGNVSFQQFAEHHRRFLKESFGFRGCQMLKVVGSFQQLDHKINTACV